MPIDTSIYQRGSLADPAGAFLHGVQMARQMRAEDERRQLQREQADALREQRQTLAEQRQQQMQAAAVAQIQEAKLRELFQQPDQVTPGAIYSIVGPQKGAEILKGMAALQEQHAQTFKTAQGVIGAVLGGIKALPEGLRPDGYATARQALIQRGLIQETDAPEQYDPAFLDQIERSLLSPEQRYQADHPKMETVSPGATMVDPRTGRPVFTAPNPSLEETIRHNKTTEADARRARAEAAKPSASEYEWVTRNGQPLQIVKGTAQPGDVPYRPPQSTSETAQDRQRLARIEAARSFLGKLDELRRTINTKMGPSAGASGLVRRGRAAIGMDPDVAEYERLRAAGGRALAVAIMGAQNLSDADAEAWANMLPSATTDEETAKRLLGNVSTQLETLTGGQTPATGSAPTKIGRFTVEVEGP